MRTGCHSRLGQPHEINSAISCSAFCDHLCRASLGLRCIMSLRAASADSSSPVVLARRKSLAQASSSSLISTLTVFGRELAAFWSRASCFKASSV
jgi:hypothetical protein